MSLRIKLGKMSNQSKRNTRTNSWFMTSRLRVSRTKIRGWHQKTHSLKIRYLKLKACLSRNLLRYTRYLRARRISKMLFRLWRSRFRANNRKSYSKIVKFRTWWHKKPWLNSKNTSLKIIIKTLLVQFGIWRKSTKMTTNRTIKRFL
jgi:hypothetical protein